MLSPCFQSSCRVNGSVVRAPCNLKVAGLSPDKADLEVPWNMKIFLSIGTFLHFFSIGHFQQLTWAFVNKPKAFKSLSLAEIKWFGDAGCNKSLYLFWFLNNVTCNISDHNGLLSTVQMSPCFHSNSVADVVRVWLPSCLLLPSYCNHSIPDVTFIFCEWTV